jgi:F-type H+-transporting ATPase subunit b
MKTWVGWAALGLGALSAGTAVTSEARAEESVHAAGASAAHAEGHTVAGHTVAGHTVAGQAVAGQAVAGQAGEAHAGGEVHEHHQEFNWYSGLLGEKADVEPGLLWRAPGTPAPFVAQLFNTLLLVGLFLKFGRQPLARGLADRRQRILRGIEDAAAMQAEATEQLRVYRNKLDNLDAEVERVRREMRESAETERRRALEEAGARRTRLEQEARVLIERELEALREELTKETALAALASARELLQRSVSTDDHRRLCEEYLQKLSPGGASAEVQRPSDSTRPALLGRSEAP